MKALGLFGATISEAYGGLGLSASTYAKIVSRICEVWMAPSGIFNSHLIMANCGKDLQLNGFVVTHSGAPDRWLSDIAFGDQNLTLKNADFDVILINAASENADNASIGSRFRFSFAQYF